MDFRKNIFLFVLTGWLQPNEAKDEARISIVDKFKPSVKNMSLFLLQYGSYLQSAENAVKA